jgi:hypothetical protein
MVLKPINEITSRTEAIAIAREWQNDFANHNYSYEELEDFLVYFSELAEKFDLTDEFQENGII